MYNLINFHKHTANEKLCGKGFYEIMKLLFVIFAYRIVSLTYRETV